MRRRERGQSRQTTEKEQGGGRKEEWVQEQGQGEEVLLHVHTVVVAMWLSPYIKLELRSSCVQVL